MEIFTLIKGNRIYYLGDKGNTKKKIRGFEFKRLPILENCIISIHKISKRNTIMNFVINTFIFAKYLILLNLDNC